MNRKPDPEMIDDENPEWMGETASRAVRFDQMPEQFQAMMKRNRGPNRAPTKQQVTLRLSPDVLDGFKEFGQGWQTRMDSYDA